MAFETSSPEKHVAAPPTAQPEDHQVIVLPPSETLAEAAPPGSVSSAEGDVRVVWTPLPADEYGNAASFVPRRARPPWLRPDVLVLAEELPQYLRGEKGFHVLSDQGLRDLLSAPPRGVRRPIVAVPDAFECDAGLLGDLRRLEDAGVPVLSLSAVARQRCRLEFLDQEPVHVPSHGAGVVSRRALDIVAGVLGVTSVLLLLPFVAAALWLEDRGPVFYAQERVGRGGRLFKLLKFRSMYVDAERSGPAWATSNDLRTTRVGAFLRRFKIDELPQFINVLLGHMSLVGPRPERPFFVEILKSHVPHYEVRHLVRPGLTGWGTVKVGYGNSIEAKYLAHQFDLYHLANRSLRFDLEIMVRSTRFLFLSPEVVDRYML